MAVLATRETMRLDKWLWHARFFRTRTLASEVVEAGHVRVNARRVQKPAFGIGEGDTLTFPQAGRIRVVRVLGSSLRRGPATEAQALYIDIAAEGIPASPASEE
ncbi:tRNA synthetase RNA-binding protein [Haematobacter massiliensis]|uniref:tRNA synthetase RNA-binding protein n=1 Tax=Haematobacter massiliensis TaxID=195105 RepID=A0A086YD03_9RHOB|nr:tRNA synthetase RNA-binding protein [Haematobacter massiliensis]